MNTYSWDITGDLATKNIDGLSQVVVQVPFSLAVTDGDQTATIVGTANLTPPDPQNFTPFANLTKDQVLAWVSVSPDGVTAMANGDHQIADAEAAAQITFQPAPWAAAS